MSCDANGHLVSMLVILLPFALMSALLNWQREIRIGASATGSAELFVAASLLVVVGAGPAHVFV